MKITTQIILWFLAIVLAGCNPNGSATNQQPATNANALSNLTVVANETIPQPVPIEGLFGVKLGEPLPPNCIISSASETIGGFYAIIFTPPETNAAFNSYVVYLDGSRRVVATIDGGCKPFGDNSEFERTKDAVLAKFRERYGKEEFGGGGKMYWYSWKSGKRDVTLTEYPEIMSFSVSCTDEDLYDSVEKSKPPVDTHGL